MKACLLALLLVPCLARAADKPNVVFLLADDLGYGDLGVTGHPHAKTPAIDKLAKQGSLFTNFRVGGATCCPTRTAFMTGRFPATFPKYPAAHGFSGAATISELLQQAGYRTGHFGKWHIGDVQKRGTYGLDVLQVTGGNRRDPRGRDAVVTDNTIEFLRAAKGKPFFVNVWFHTPHNPVNPPQPFVDRFREVKAKAAEYPHPDFGRRLDEYAAAGEDVHLGLRKRLGDIAQLDGQVARILKAINDLGLRENTLVVFTSDNGPNPYGSAGPFRGAKHTLYEGGIRQPLLLRWPGKVAAGRVDESSAIAAVDWLPSLTSLAGVAAPAKLDGEDRSAVWLGGVAARKKDLFFKASAPNSAPVMVRGSWKLHLPRRGPAELYDLAKDPSERRNVADSEPAKLKELTAALRAWNASLPTSYDKGGAKDD